jgi:hypothetical protein
MVFRNIAADANSVATPPAGPSEQLGSFVKRKCLFPTAAFKEAFVEKCKFVLWFQHKQKRHLSRLCENTLMKAQQNAPTCSGRLFFVRATDEKRPFSPLAPSAGGLRAR